MDVEVASDGGVHDPAGEDVGEAAVITSTSDGVKHSYRRGGRGQPALWGGPEAAARTRLTSSCSCSWGSRAGSGATTARASWCP